MCYIDLFFLLALCMTQLTFLGFLFHLHLIFFNLLSSPPPFFLFLPGIPYALTTIQILN